MGPECAALYKSLDDLRIACELAVLAAIDHFQKLYPNPLDWTIEVIEGSNLAQDGTLGFYLAATRAAVRVTGFSSGIESDVHGWEEVS